MRAAAAKAEVRMLFGRSWKSLRGVSEVTERRMQGRRVHFGAVFLHSGSTGEKGLTLMKPVPPITEGSSW